MHHRVNQKPTLLVFSLLLHENFKSQMSKVSERLKEYEQENVASRIMIFFQVTIELQNRNTGQRIKRLCSTKNEFCDL